MPVVGDFNVIQEDPITIGDNNPVWTKRFGTGGRESGVALLMYSIRGLTYAPTGARISINSWTFEVHPYPGRDETAGAWYMQMHSFNGLALKGSTPNNIVKVEAARLGPDDTTGTNVFDDFQIKDITVFFHQDA